MNYRRFYLINGVIKYPLNCNIKNAIYKNLYELENLDNFIFYSKDSINCKNYIYDKSNDIYYLIESGYYYYINKSKSNLILNYVPDTFIYYLKIKN